MMQVYNSATSATTKALSILSDGKLVDEDQGQHKRFKLLSLGLVKGQ